MVLVDESSMVQPSDVALFASRLQFDTDKKIQYVLVGDFAPVQHDLKPVSAYSFSKLAPTSAGKGARRAFHFKPNTHNSITVCCSRSNNGEAHEIAAYARTLIAEYRVAPHLIVALTPYSAQSELLQKVMPANTTTTKTRKFQLQETSIVLFSACNHGSVNGKPSNGVTPDGRVVIGKDGKTVELRFINDPALVLVSLTRTRHSTVIFGNEKFLRSIPVWDKVISAIKS